MYHLPSFLKMLLARSRFSQIVRMNGCLTLGSLLCLVANAGEVESIRTQETWATALAEFKQARAEINVVGGSLKGIAETEERFLSHVNVEELGLEDLARVVQVNPFKHSDLGREKAGAVERRIDALAPSSEKDSALAATLKATLADMMGSKNAEKAELGARAVRHAGFPAVLQSEFSDLAMVVAFRAPKKEGEDRALFLSVPEKLDPLRSYRAIQMLDFYWEKVTSVVPESALRQQIRQRLAELVEASIRATESLPDAAEARTRMKRVQTLLNGPAARGGLVGQLAPELHFRWSSSPQVKALSDLRGKIVVLDFWATWCGACLASFDEVRRFQEKYRGTDVVVIGVTSLQGAVFGFGPAGKAIDCRGKPEKELELMAQYVAEKNLSWPIAISEEAVMNPEYGIRGIPTHVVIDRNGYVRAMTEGFVAEELEKVVEEARKG